MAVDAELKAQILEETGPLIESAAISGAVAAVAAGITAFVATNYKSSTLTGDTVICPSEDRTVISKVESSASDTDASLAKDEVTGNDGDLSASRTDAAASSGEATALDSGAQAARTKAGAADIETKALKMT